MHLNQAIVVKTIIPQDKFDDLKIQFTSEHDPLTNGPFKLTYLKENFIELEASTPILFKIAVQESKELAADSLPLSLKYEIMNRKTCFIGVQKLLQKPDEGESQLVQPMDERLFKNKFCAQEMQKYEW